MNRITGVLTALILLLTACGSAEGSFRDELATMGVSDEMADCLIEELGARGLSVEDVSDQAIGDGDLPAGADEAWTTCLADVDDAARVVDDDISPGDAADGDTDDDDSDGDGDEPTDDIMTRPLDLLEQAFVDGAMEEGATEEAARCVLGELMARDLELLDLAATGEDMPPEVLQAVFACGDELIEGGAFDLDTGEGGAYGDDPELDALWDACAAGDMNTCDELFWESPVGSEYEEFAETCGGTTVPQGLCGDGAGLSFDSDFSSDDPDTYGDDPELDALWDACEAGDGEACDDLFWTSPLDSGYEEFGRSCGGREPGGLGCADEAA